MIGVLNNAGTRRAQPAMFVHGLACFRIDSLFLQKVTPGGAPRLERVEETLFVGVGQGLHKFQQFDACG